VEVEAAARAAERIAPRRLAPIDRALRAIEAAMRKGEGAVNEDFAFHLAIAEASGNTRFAQLLEFLGRHVIPRQSVRLASIAPPDQQQYLARIQDEHRRIQAAIAGGDAAEARKAMREHLTRSIRRYRQLAERAQGANSE
jgi:DNA-binding FadR family transcriptional regulator